MKPSTPTRPRVSAAAKPAEAGAKSQAHRQPAPRNKRSVAAQAEPVVPQAEPAGTTLADVAGAVLNSPRRNAEALVEAGRKSYAGIEAVLQRHVDILRDTLAELRTVRRVMREVGVRESVVHLDQLARGAVELTLVSVSELAGLAAATQREALQVLATRRQGDLAESRRLRSGPHPTPAP